MSGNTGDATGSLSTYSEIMSVVAVVIWGTLSDRMSRRSIMSISLVIIGVITIAYPHAKNLYPTLLILRLIYSIGTAGVTCMMAAMMVEIMGKRNGFLVGLIGICTGLGAIFAAFCLFSVPSRFAYLQKDLYDPISIVVGYATIGACCAFVGFLLWPAMPKKKGPGSDDAVAVPTERRSYKDFFIRLYRGIKAGKNPSIALGFISSFFARADEIVISNFISLWIQEYYIEAGMCTIGATCYPASGTTETMTGIAQSVALASAPLFAIMSEFLPKEYGVMLAGVIGAVGCFPFARSLDPTSNTSLAYVILIAIGQYGMIISGMAMIGNNNIEPDIQGSVAGAYSFCGAIGIIIVSKIGGVLFDKFMKGAPFLLLGIGHVICSLFALVLACIRLFHYIRDRRQNK
ncbi:major facilitator superfamily domain-containing protein [Dichotomocladium elegans]|nr:major facilitator superfamily domain-containing protein [Dichotomocladium elegans]